LLRFVLFVCFAAITCSAAVESSAAGGPGYVRKVAGFRTAIVFVHGIFGDARETWTNPVTKAYFPDLVATDSQFAGADVYTYEYPTSFLNAPFSIDEISENMRLFFDNDEISAHQNLVFVTHSMGGLVTRAYLLKNREAAARTRMIYFYSTPTTGSEIAAIASLVTTNPHLAKMRPMASADYLADLQRQWLAADFEIPSYCAYETQNTYGVSVVTQASASNLCTKRLDPIAADHISIVKPNGVRDVPFVALKSAFSQSMKSSSSEPIAGLLRSAGRAPSESQAGMAVLFGAGEYTAFVNVTVVNKDKQFNTIDLLDTLFRYASAKFKQKDDTPVRVESDDCVRSDKEFRCSLLLGFGTHRPAKGEVLELQFGPLLATHEISESTFTWEVKDTWRGIKNRDRPPAYVAVSEVAYEISKIDWLVLSDAEVIFGINDQSLLKFSVTNPTGRSKSIRRLVFVASQSRGGACAAHGEKQEDTVLNLDWEKIISGLPSAAVLNLRGVIVPVRVVYNPDLICLGYHLTASLPMFEVVEAYGTKQIFVRINEIPNKILSARSSKSEKQTVPPKRLAAWPALYIRLEGDAAEAIVPTGIYVQRQQN
jgi:pimeloyl-ACP methyl ester carboxylesterase